MPRRKKLTSALLIMAGLLSAVMIYTVSSAESTDTAEYAVQYWVEKPDLQGDPGNPAEEPDAKSNFELVNYETRRGKIGGTIALSAEEAGPFLRTDNRQRRYASYLDSDTVTIREDGKTELNVYYKRDVFAYEFDLTNEQSTMTVGGKTYTGGGERYTIYGKYEQQVIVPGLQNGLMPENTNPALQGAYCMGWMLDERAGIGELLTYTNAITEEMLPTDDMPYEDLVFTLRGVWQLGSDRAILTSWYEQLPEHEGLADVNRMTYGGKVYVNFPATDYEMLLPAGAKPEASSAPGLSLVAKLEPGASGEGADVTWKFIYDRDQYAVTLHSSMGEGIPAIRGVRYQQNLSPFDPGWNGETTQTSGGKTYRFTGWFTDGGARVAERLSEIYMPAFDLSLTAGWELIE